MHNVIRMSGKGVFLLPIVAAFGCIHPSLVGVSADIDAQPASTRLKSASAPEPQPRRSTLVISGTENQYPVMRTPSLGDLDGDGLDDFLVEAGESGADYDAYNLRSFLFYGKTELPAPLSTAHADAVLASGELPAVGVGDINGDGLADFTIGDWDGYEIILGSSARLSGEQPRFGSGLAWQRSGDLLPYVRPLGDVNGDGMAELRVTVISDVPEHEVANRAPELITDYLVSGRQGGWPTGPWDPTWAVAMLGDEPPAFEDNGTKTVLQRLQISGTGDLDGDGYIDLLALGRWSIWVFYGSASGFRGTLTPEQANASLHWPHDESASREDFAKTIPITLGDVDGDGTVDIGVPHHAELGIVYGSKQRFSGRVDLQPELTIVRQNSELPERNWWMALADDVSFGALTPQLVSTQIRVSSVDLDGDAQPELALHENRFPAARSYTDPFESVMYVVTGTSQRATGRYVLSDADIHVAKGIRDSDAALTSGLLLDRGGDIDGDGSTDLIFGVPKAQADGSSKVYLHVVPGAPHAPD
ncbi:MAG: VCBS repeat-containing protein [Polyangiales bacterium]